jgi:hypothetical protein
VVVSKQPFVNFQPRYAFCSSIVFRAQVAVFVYQDIFVCGGTCLCNAYRFLVCILLGVFPPPTAVPMPHIECGCLSKRLRNTCVCISRHFILAEDLDGINLKDVRVFCMRAGY